MRPALFGVHFYQPYLFLNSETFNFPFQGDGSRLFNPLNDCFSECFNIAGGSVAGINQKVAVDVGDFGAADPQIGTAGFFNEFPSFETFGVFESGTAGAGVAGLAFQTICLLLVQFLFYRFRGVRVCLERQRENNPVVGKITAAVRKQQVVNADGFDFAAAVDDFGPNDDVFDFLPETAGIGFIRAADDTGD